MLKITTTCCLAALTLGLHAGETTAVAPQPSAGASSGDVFFGINARDDAWYTYGGCNFALNGDKSTNGFILHGLLGYGEYEYDTALGGVDGDVSELDFGLGYQWYLPGFRVSLIGALNLTDHDLTGSPIDLANNSVNGSETGFKAKIDIWNTDASNYLYGGTFSYSTAYESYWNRVMFAARVGSVYLGPEFIFQGNEEYQEFRTGLTIAGVKIGMLDIGASVGYAWADPDQGSSEQEGIYSTIHMSFSF